MTTTLAAARIAADHRRHAVAVFRAMPASRAAEYRVKARQRARLHHAKTAYHRRRRNR